MTNKYSAKCVWLHTLTGLTTAHLPLDAIKPDWLYFPSRLEFKVYDLLKCHDKIATVRTHYVITLCEGITWCIDFLITTKSGKELYIEAKGCETQLYKAKFKMCKALRPDVFEKLHIIKTINQLKHLPL